MDEQQLPRDASWPVSRRSPKAEALPDPDGKRPTLAELAKVHQDAEALELRRRYHSYPEIRTILGFKTVNDAMAATHRASERLRVLHEDDEAGIALELSRYDELAREVLKVLDQKHYVISNSGRIIEDPETGQPLRDPAPILQAVDRLVTISRERRRIQALDRPATTRVEVRTVDAMDSEIERLLNLFADATRPQRKQIAANLTETHVEQITDAEVVDDPTQREGQ